MAREHPPKKETVPRTTGALYIWITLIALAYLAQCAVDATYYSWFGFSGAVTIVVAGLFGIAGGFGRLRWALILAGVLTLIGIPFALVAGGAFSEASRTGNFITQLQISIIVFSFVTGVLAFIGMILAFVSAAFPLEPRVGRTASIPTTIARPTPVARAETIALPPVSPGTTGQNRALYSYPPARQMDTFAVGPGTEV